MLIEKKRIRTLKGRVGRVAPGSKIIVGQPLVPADDVTLQRIGFRPGVHPGDTVLPAVIGPRTRFNAEGDFIINKEAPKEEYYLTRDWTRTEFHGPERVETSDIVYDRRERYARTRVPPPAVELTIKYTAEGQRVLVSPVIEYQGESDAHLIHVINVFLEIFRRCETFSEDLSSIIQAPVERLNWQLLPKGKRTWKQLKPDLQQVIENVAKGVQPVIEHRFETINSYEPSFVAVGRAGFAGYVVFGFEDRDLFVFESIYQNNATYVFGDQWRNLSQLTKTEVLDNRLHKARILHQKTWASQVGSLLRPTPRSGK